MDIKVGDVVITDDETHWRIYSITHEGRRRSFIALHFSSPRVLSADVMNLTWSGTESAWRFKVGGGRPPEPGRVNPSG